MADINDFKWNDFATSSTTGANVTWNGVVVCSTCNTCPTCGSVKYTFSWPSTGTYINCGNTAANGC